MHACTQGTCMVWLAIPFPGIPCVLSGLFVFLIALILEDGEVVETCVNRTALDPVLLST